MLFNPLAPAPAATPVLQLRRLAGRMNVKHVQTMGSGENDVCNINNNCYSGIYLILKCVEMAAM